MGLDFEPERKIITAITNASPAVVTAALHGYTSDDIVKINVPIEYGMRLPRYEYRITVRNANSFSIGYDTTSLDAFVVPAVATFTKAEVLPISAEMDNIGT